jgi:hypothetical protein
MPRMLLLVVVREATLGVLREAKTEPAEESPGQGGTAAAQASIWMRVMGPVFGLADRIGAVFGVMRLVTLNRCFVAGP